MTAAWGYLDKNPKATLNLTLENKSHGPGN